MTNKEIIYTGLFNDSFFPVVDGVAVAVENYARWLPLHQMQPAIITPWNKQQTNFEFPLMRYLSIPIIGRKPYRLGLQQIDPFIHWKLAQTRFNIVHAHCPFSSGQLALKVAKRQHIPLIATFHSKFKDDLQRSFHGQKRLVNHIINNIIDFFNQCDQVWIPQADVEQTIREYGFKGEVTVISNGNDLSDRIKGDIISYKLSAKKKIGIDNAKLAILFVGQHINEKGLPLIIEILDKLHKLQIQFEMNFIGTGYALGWLQKEIIKRKLENCVYTHGLIKDRDKLADFYAASDLFLFPSKYDNAPLVVREAAAMSTPSLLLKGSTAAEIASDNKDAFLCNENLEQIISLISMLAKNRQKLIETGINASKSINLSWKDIVEEVADRYKQAIKSYKG